MQEPIGLGFIGCGKHALRSHAITVSAMPEMFKIRAAYDKDQSAAGKIATLSAGTYMAKDAFDLINNPEVQAVVIATPDEFHLELSELAVSAGKHVLCEKPLWVGLFTDKAEALIEKSEKSGLIFTSCHPRRFEKGYLFVKSILDELKKNLGNLMEFNFRFFYQSPSTQWKMSGSLLLDHMNHEIDLMNFMLGYAPVKLRRKIDGHDRYYVTGMRAEILPVSFGGYRRLAEPAFQNELELVFEGGRIKVKSILKNGITDTAVTQEKFGDREKVLERWRSPYTDTFRAVMANFGGAIWGAEENYLTPKNLIINSSACNILVEYGEFWG